MSIDISSCNDYCNLYKVSSMSHGLLATNGGIPRNLQKLQFGNHPIPMEQYQYHILISTQVPNGDDKFWVHDLYSGFLGRNFCCLHSRVSCLQKLVISLVS